MRERHRSMRSPTWHWPYDHARSKAENQFSIDVGALPRSVLVGTVEIVGCRPLEKSDSKPACIEINKASVFFAWLLERPERAEELETPKKHPRPVFFNPF